MTDWDQIFHEKNPQVLDDELSNSLNIISNSTPSDQAIDFVKADDFEWCFNLVALIADEQSSRNVRVLCMNNLLAAGELFPNIFVDLGNQRAFELWVFADLQIEDDTELIYLSLCFIKSLCQKGDLKSEEKLKLGFNLCKFIIKLIFQYEGDDDYQQIYDMSLNTLVAIYYLFKENEDSIIITCLNENERVYDFGQKFIHVLNRRDDLFIVKACQELMKYLLSDPDIASKYFFLNDLNVLVDISLRELENLGEGQISDEIRHSYMDVIELLILKSEYTKTETKHRPHDIIKLLRDISQDSADKQLANHAQKILETCESRLVN